MVKHQVAYKKKKIEEAIEKMLEGIELTTVENAVLEWFKKTQGVCLGSAMVLKNKKFDRKNVE